MKRLRFSIFWTIIFCWALPLPAGAQQYYIKKKPAQSTQAKPAMPIIPTSPAPPPDNTAGPAPITLQGIAAGSPAVSEPLYETGQCSAQDKQALKSINRGFAALSSEDTVSGPAAGRMQAFLETPGGIDKITALMLRCPEVKKN